MTFREGLLKARGQLTFIAALAISTGIIIYLETLDTEAHIQSRVASEIARRNGSAAEPAPALRGAVRSTLAQSEEAYAADPSSATNRAALLISLSTAVRLGILKPEEGLSKAQKVVDEIAQRRGETNIALSSALSAAAATFPSLQERVSTLQSGS